MNKSSTLPFQFVQLPGFERWGVFQISLKTLEARAPLVWEAPLVPERQETIIIRACVAAFARIAMIASTPIDSIRVKAPSERGAVERGAVERRSVERRSVERRSVGASERWPTQR